MATGDDDPPNEGNKERGHLRVASRAIRRGRKLRSSYMPPAIGDDPEGERATAELPPKSLDWEEGRGGSTPPDEPAGAEAKARVIRLSDGPSIQVRESSIPDAAAEGPEVQKISRYSRPPAPMLDLGKRDESPAKREEKKPASLQELAQQASEGDDDFGEPVSSDAHRAVQPAPFQETTLVSSTGLDQEESRAADDDQEDEAEEGATAAQPTPSVPTPASASAPSGPVSAPVTPRSPRSAPVSTPRSPRSAPVSTPRSTPGATDTVAGLDDASATRTRALVLLLAGLGLLVYFAKFRTPEPAPAPVATAHASAAKPKPSAKPSAALAASAAPEESAAPSPSAAASDEVAADEPPGDDYDAVQKKTVRLLSERKFTEAEKFARKMIELRPDDALGYRCLGGALQDQSRGADARAVYSDCVTHATKGDVKECQLLGGVMKK